ncbi:hypothetical protein ACR6C2_44315 [Streptomyces sp. INA 01156]
MSTQQATDGPRAHCTVDTDGRITFRLRLRSSGRPRLELVPRPKKTGRSSRRTSSTSNPTVTTERSGRYSHRDRNSRRAAGTRTC